MRWLICILLLLGTAPMVRAASFDCKLAKTPQEKAICASAELGKADEALASAYKIALGGLSPTMSREVRNDEGEWLRWVGTICDAGKVQLGATLAKCMVGEYRERAEILARLQQRHGGLLFVTRTRALAVADKPGEEHGFDHARWGTLVASWPEAVSDAAEWKAWTAGVEAETVAAPEGRAVAGWNAEWASGQDATVDAELGRIGEGRVTTHIGVEMMGHGAAHPNEFGESFHWMLKEQREMKVADVFQPGSGWAKVVTARCERGLKKQLGADYEYIDPMDKSVGEVITTPHNWDMDAKGLTISFPEYTVTPRAEPADDVMVPWAELQPFLEATFVRPQ
jgi:uncharacterized protein YecT (DUF1311 family)